MEPLDDYIKEKELELGVVFPPIFKREVCRKPLHKFADWEIIHPMQWYDIDVVFSKCPEPPSGEWSQGNRGVVIGFVGGIDVMLLMARADSPRDLEESIFEWESERNRVRRVGPSLAQPNEDRPTHRQLEAAANLLLRKSAKRTK